jgi:hypothetical protein
VGGRLAPGAPERRDARVVRGAGGLGRLLGLDRDSPGFTLVYAEAEEQLHHIDNRTVSAFLHLSLVG